MLAKKSASILLLPDSDSSTAIPITWPSMDSAVEIPANMEGATIFDETIASVPLNFTRGFEPAAVLRVPSLIRYCLAPFPRFAIATESRLTILRLDLMHSVSSFRNCVIVLGAHAPLICLH